MHGTAAGDPGVVVMVLLRRGLQLGRGDSCDTSVRMPMRLGISAALPQLNLKFQVKVQKPAELGNLKEVKQVARGSLARGILMQCHSFIMQ